MPAQLSRFVYRNGAVKFGPKSLDDGKQMKPISQCRQEIGKEYERQVRDDKEE
jgi:hypothetical protein